MELLPVMVRWKEKSSYKYVEKWLAVTGYGSTEKYDIILSP